MPTRPDRFQILQARPAHDLINSLGHAQKQLAAVQLTPEQKRNLDRWVEIEFASATLGLEGVAVSREHVALLDADPSTSDNTNRERNSQIINLLKAIRTVRSLCETSGRAAQLTPELLIKLHSSLGYEAISPTDPGEAQPSSERVAAPRSLAQIESACRWFAAESFVELHPTEQASIVLLRMLELKQFEEGNIRLALVASSLFSVRSGLPAIIIKPELQGEYRAALSEGIRMNTKPMVDLVGHALLLTVGEMLKRVA
jgi:hypothetical protein